MFLILNVKLSRYAIDCRNKLWNQSASKTEIKEAYIKPVCNEFLTPFLRFVPTRAALSDDISKSGKISMMIFSIKSRRIQWMGTTRMKPESQETKRSVIDATL